MTIEAFQLFYRPKFGGKWILAQRFPTEEAAKLYATTNLAGKETCIRYKFANQQAAPQESESDFTDAMNEKDKFSESATNRNIRISKPRK